MEERLDRLSRFLEKMVSDSNYEETDILIRVKQDLEELKPKPKKLVSIYPSQKVQDNLMRHFYDCKV